MKKRQQRVPAQLHYNQSGKEGNRSQEKKAKQAKNQFLSPFRYPGGKSWFVDIVRQWIKQQSIKPKTLVEPFAGGAAISLTAAHEDLVHKAVFAELDKDVAATWQTLLNGKADWLSQKILTFQINRKNVKEILLQSPATHKDRAFQCILRNRTARGGIISEGAGLLRQGEDGNGIGSRWYPVTLANRIRTISSIKKKLKFVKGDGFKLIRKYIRNKNTLFFVDPPYTKAARRLYKHWLIVHETLFQLLSHAKGPVLMTYDDKSEIRQLAKKYGFKVMRISMRTTHHKKKRELMISKSFDWKSSH